MMMWCMVSGRLIQCMHRMPMMQPIADAMMMGVTVVTDGCIRVESTGTKLT